MNICRFTYMFHTRNAKVYLKFVSRTENCRDPDPEVAEREPLASQQLKEADKVISHFA
ncbi:hypothetical protein LZG72_14620 [Dyadobacter sp. CY323]|nr:hypothetical protein [Dyadobacter sp. CY323]MCE6990335.1 hypothetical protein [Dyadobacter sp. CY323]